MKQTSHKAWAGAVGAALATVLSRFLNQYEPWFAAQDFAALHDVVAALAGGAIGYVATWLGPANRRSS